MKDTGRKGKAKFKVGQVVMCDSATRALKVIERWCDDSGKWWYDFYSYYPVEQSSLRAQTKRERGA